MYMLSYHMSCGLLLLHSALTSSNRDLISVRKLSWVVLLWREYLVPYSLGGLYHLDSLGLWDLILCLWEKLICIWLVLPPNSKDPSPKVHFRDDKTGLHFRSCGIIPRHPEMSELDHIEKLTHDNNSLGESEGFSNLFTSSSLQSICISHYPGGTPPLSVRWSALRHLRNDESENKQNWIQPRCRAPLYQIWLVDPQQRAWEPSDRDGLV